MSTGNPQPIPISSNQSAPAPAPAPPPQQITIYLNPAVPAGNEHSHLNHQQQQPSDHHQLSPPKALGSASGETYQISPMLPVSSGDLHQPQHHHQQQQQQQQQQSFIHVTSHNTITTTPAAAAPNTSLLSSATPDQNHNVNSQEQQNKLHQHQDEQQQFDQNSPSSTRFKWTEEKSQVAMNLVKYGCKPKLISVAVGCSLRTAQKFAETVTPKIEGESFKTYQIKRRGRKSKDVNQRLNAIREVLSKDSTKTQVEIADYLKVSNTTVCRDLKRLGASWKEKKNGNSSSNNSTLESNNGDEQATKQTASETTSQPPQQQTTTRKTRQSNSRGQNNNNNINININNNNNNNINDTNDTTKNTTAKSRRQQRRNNKTNNEDATRSGSNAGQDPLITTNMDTN